MGKDIHAPEEKHSGSPQEPSIETDPRLEPKEMHPEAPEESRPENVGPALREPFDFLPEVVPVPEGEFWMGSGEDEWYAWKNEKPRHKVWLDAYQIGRHPVTVAQFRVFVERRSYRTTAEVRGDDKTWRIPLGKDRNLISEDNHPVTCVSWEDAQAYCLWLSEVTGRSYGLPTEAQWEKAARGTDGRIYPWGNTRPSRWNDLSNNESWYRRTTPVGHFSPAGDSPYGCSDMTGNVMGWCADWYRLDYYTNSPYRNPAGPESSNHRVVRGGSFSTMTRNARCATRNLSVAVNSLNFLGFRVVLLPSSTLTSGSSDAM